MAYHTSARRRPRRSLSCLWLLGAIVGILVGPLPAQASRVTVFLLEADEASQTQAGALYNALRTQVQLHPSYTLNDIPTQTLEETLRNYGCAELDLICSEMIGDTLGSELLLHGSLQQGSNGERRVRLILWDARSAQTMQSVEHTLRDRDRAFDTHIAILGRSVLYGAEGMLTITSTPPGAQVRVNGEPRGSTPLEIRDLRLGLYAVELALDGHGTWLETIAVDIGNNDVRARMRAASVDRTPGDPGPGMRYAAYGLVGAGVVSLGVGAFQGIQMRDAQKEFDRVAPQDPARAEQLRQDGQRHATLANVFLITGGLLVAGGVVMAVLAPRADEQPATEGARAQGDRLDPAAGARHSLQLAPTGALWRIDFR